MKILVISVLSFLLLVNSALALNVTLSVDKTRVLMGENVTLTGTITDDNGTAKAFEYRAAFVGPKRVIICDTNKTMTASDGTFSLNCKIPTAQEANSSGIPASLTRSVIPYKAGVVVKDPATNDTVKRHAKTIIAVNPDKFNNELNNLIRHFDNFVNHSQRFVPECDAIAEKAARFNVTHVVEQCLLVQQNINGLITNATSLSDQARQLKANLNATNLEDFRDALKTLKESMKDLKDEINDLRDNIRSVRWESLKEVREKISEIRGEIEEKRGEIREIKNRSGRQGGRE